VTEDDAQAASWYRKAADQGSASGQNMLGMMYELGRGVPKDYGQAMRLFRKSADQGDSSGQMLVGSMYRDGLGVPVDYAQAKVWYTKAGDNGSERAKKNLDDLEEQVHAQVRKVSIPGAIEFMCFFDATPYSRSGAEAGQKYDVCLRTTWKKFFGSLPFPND
jgi:hypothetical protein